jgi:predicted aspartyl protease
MRVRALALVLTGVAAGGLAGCGTGRSVARRTSATRSVSVPLTVYRSHGLVAALVRITLEDHPYYFVVDTGAASTVIDARVASRLGLRDDGSPRRSAPLGCKVSAQPVALPRWRLGNASFPASTVLTQRLLIPSALPHLPLAGLLGSDFLSRSGAVTIDLAHRRLILGGSTRLDRGGHAVRIKILRFTQGGRGVTTRVDLDRHRAWFVVDTGASVSAVDAQAAAARRLQAVGPKVGVTGAVCHRTATPVLVHSWSVAGLRFSNAVIGRASELLPQRVVREGVIGIVGMATLARFGVLTIDYSHARMILGGSGD